MSPDFKTIKPLLINFLTLPDKRRKRGLDPNLPPSLTSFEPLLWKVRGTLNFDFVKLASLLVLAAFGNLMSLPVGAQLIFSRRKAAAVVHNRDRICIKGLTSRNGNCLVKCAEFFELDIAQCCQLVKRNHILMQELRKLCTILLTETQISLVELQ